MENPYQNLVIYYFEGRVEPDLTVTADPRFLGNWQEADTSFVFFSKPVPFFAKQMADQYPDASLADVYEMTWEQWHGDSIQPYCLEGFCVYPPWELPADDPDRRSIILDPGVVFGTGMHQTTRDCMELIHHLCTKKNIETVMDIGTGTGLLALGAAAMGCRWVLACDFNRLAVQTARKNIVLNQWNDRVLAFQARGEDMMELPCDLVVANIHYDIMQQLLASPGLLDRQYLILSGLLHSQTRKVLETLEQKQVHIIQHRCPDGIWNTLLARPSTAGSCGVE
ncbi:MAG: 50S ribosomal protein L11 methyltransferase [Desulfobacteraceae bacterium]|nr:50S ribosomal protein L11 methyltransferase [Desulfobacteraceae bacterium]